MIDKFHADLHPGLISAHENRGVLATIALAALFFRNGTGFTPNYADRMLSPVDGEIRVPQLFPARRTLPIRVGVVPDEARVTEARLDAVREGCRRWTQALGEVVFDFVPVRRPGDADVVFVFGAVPPGHDLKGMTVERGGWASVFLAVEEADGTPLPLVAIRRVATHEMGHALGIWGHSPDAADVMSTHPSAETVTPADANTLRLAYLPKP